jgi:hypothetical protein
VVALVLSPQHLRSLFSLLGLMLFFVWQGVRFSAASSRWNQSAECDISASAHQPGTVSPILAGTYLLGLSYSFFVVLSSFFVLGGAVLVLTVSISCRHVGRWELADHRAHENWRHRLGSLRFYPPPQPISHARTHAQGDLDLLFSCLGVYLGNSNAYWETSIEGTVEINLVSSAPGFHSLVRTVDN